MNTTDALWKKYAARVPGILDRRPDFQFDPSYYEKHVPKPGATPDSLLEHYRQTGAQQGLPPTLYAEMFARQPGIDDILRELVIAPDLVQLIEAGVPGALHLACELINLGSPIDAEISDFSCSAYLKVHPDIARAKMNPLLHYLLYGAGERRKTLAFLRKSQYPGQQPYLPERPTCLICVHECSKTGAPIVGLDLAREAAKTHNVIVSALRDGALLDDFRKTAWQVLITSDPLADFDYYQEGLAQKIDFAIVNSVVSWNYIPFLVAKDIPFAGYIHEYAEYTYPAYQSTLFLLFSDLLIFSSDHVRRSWTGRMTDVGFDLEKDSRIIPQRPLNLGSVRPEEYADARARLSDLIGRDVSKSKIVCGAGQSQWRKGTDVFAMAAQICRKRDSDTVFIWIGHNIVSDELGFGVYMAHHFKEVGLGLPDSNFFFIPAGPAYPDVLAASDVMFLSSRLDPLPNVVFDALENGCQVVQFEGASGFNDDQYVRSERFVTVEYGNPDAAATAILALPVKSTADIMPDKPEYPLFDMIRGNLRARLDDQRYFVRGASAIDVSIIYRPDGEFTEPRIREREKILRYGRRAVWRDIEDVQEEISSSENWIHRNLKLRPYATCDASGTPRFSIHIHAYYTDDLAKDIKSYCIYHQASRIVVTTDTEEKGDAIRKIMATEGLTAEIVLVSNTGRDILPFMAMFNEGGAAGSDDLWCHLHQKKSIGSAAGGDIWRRFLMRILLGNEHEISSAIRIIAQEGVGLVAPFDPHFVGWNDSRRLLPKFAERLPGPMPENPLLFPVGNMFWVRRSVVQAMNEVFGPAYSWPDEPIANDGTEYHLIERLWPAMATHLGLDSVFVHKLDEKRV